MLKKIAFIGLGEMGGRMYPHLVKAGHKVRVYDNVNEKLEAAAKIGAEPAASALECTEDVDVIVTMLNSVAAVQSVYSEAVFPNVKEGTMMIDASTIGPEAAKDVYSAAQAHDKAASGTFLDAPVSGGIGAAAAGLLTFMVGGPKDVFDSAQVVLDPMAKAVFHAGPNVGDGQVVKLCNNSILGAHMVAVAEALLLGQKYGVSAKTMSDIFATTTANCWSVTVQNPIPGVVETAPSSKGYAGGFGASLMLKDLRLAEHAAASKQAMPLLHATSKVYSEVCGSDMGSKDFSVVAEHLKGLAPPS